MYEVSFHKQDIHDMSFLVTGGAGFIGSNLVEYLLKFGAKRVVALDSMITGNYDNINDFSDNNSYQFIEGDIRDIEVCREACKGIDYVLHQAALGSVPRSLLEPELTTSINVAGFVNMLVAAKDSGVKRFVYASSSSVYGDNKDLPQVEDRTGRALSPYAVSKSVNEQYARVFGDSFNMQIIGLRYFNVFGPRQSPQGAYAAVIPLFVHGLMTGTDIFINGDGEQTRDFTFIDNAVQANVRALFTEHADAIGKVFNVAVGESFSVNELYNAIKSYLEKDQLPTYRDPRKGEIKNSLADISNAKTLLDYDPQFRFQDGLIKTIEYFKQKVFA